MPENLTVAELLKIVRKRAPAASDRVIQHWTDKEVLHPVAGTSGHGPGVHRLYDNGEAVFALIASELNLRNAPVAEIKAITDAIRAAGQLALGRKNPRRTPSEHSDAAYHVQVIRWAMHGTYPVFAIVQRGAKGPRLLLHAVGAPARDAMFRDIPIQAAAFGAPLEEKLLDSTFNLVSGDIIRLDKVLEPARHLAPAI